MTILARLRLRFCDTWTTMLVGWNGIGTFSPWPDRSDDFPPFYSLGELSDYATERFESSCSVEEEDLIMKLLSLDIHTATRQSIREILTSLSNVSGGDSTLEIRKWRLMLLEELLDTVPTDPLYGLIALTEFWQGFGYPPECPHVVQGKGNAITPSEYYEEQNFLSVLDRHRAWAKKENTDIAASSPCADTRAHTK